MQRKSHNGSKRVALWAENPHSLKLRCGYGAERTRQRSFKPRSEFNFLFRDTAGFSDEFDWEWNTKLISVLDTHFLWHFPLIHAITKNMQEPFYKNGLKFTCKRCSFCCGHSPGFVYLSKSDLERLCAYFKMTAPDFAQKYCRWANYYHGTTVLALQEQKNYDCILWENGCSLYEHRPSQSPRRDSRRRKHRPPYRSPWRCVPHYGLRFQKQGYPASCRAVLNRSCHCRIREQPSPANRTRVQPRRWRSVQECSRQRRCGRWQRRGR